MRTLNELLDDLIYRAKHCTDEVLPLKTLILSIVLKTESERDEMLAEKLVEEPLRRQISELKAKLIVSENYLNLALHKLNAPSYPTEDGDYD